MSALSLKKIALWFSLAWAWSSAWSGLLSQTDFYKTLWIEKELETKEPKPMEVLLCYLFCLQSFEGFSVFRSWNVKRVTVCPCVVLGRKSLSLGSRVLGEEDNLSIDVHLRVVLNILIYLEQTFPESMEYTFFLNVVHRKIFSVFY